MAQDSFGQFHIRGEHNGLQYRLNGIILPEGISVFGQTLDPRLISSMKLITGALPAEYGLRTAGIIDLTTKSGLQAPGRLGVPVRRQPRRRSSRASTTAAARDPSAISSRATFCATISASNRRTAAPIRSTTTRPSITASATSRTSWMRRTAWRSCSAVSDGKFQIPNLDGAAARPRADGRRGQRRFRARTSTKTSARSPQFGALSWQHSRARSTCRPRSSPATRA